MINTGNFRRLLDSADTPEKSTELTQGNAWKKQLKQDDSLELTLYSFDSILLATNKFSTTSKLGQGGFGSVYKVRPFCRTLLMKIFQGLKAM